MLPSPALDAFLFTPSSGTLFLGNAFFVEDAAEGLIPAAFVAPAPDEAAPLLGFSFPYQPNIMESIRNLLWHVPMWFAMFFVMGIGFVASLATTPDWPSEMGPQGRSRCQNGTGLWNPRIGDWVSLGALDLGSLVGVRPTAQRSIGHRSSVLRIHDSPRRHG